MTVIYSHCLTCGTVWPEEDSIPYTRTTMLRTCLRETQHLCVDAGCKDAVHRDVLARLAKYEVVS